MEFTLLDDSPAIDTVLAKDSPTCEFCGNTSDDAAREWDRLKASGWKIAITYDALCPGCAAGYATEYPEDQLLPLDEDKVFKAPGGLTECTACAGSFYEPEQRDEWRLVAVVGLACPDCVQELKDEAQDS